jgi:phage tail sheath protein FI
MPTYLHPGVYIEELRGGAQPIQAIGTSTAAFVGFARQGPIGTPDFITRWDDYQSRYGGILPGDPLDVMGHTVNAFFLNGGSTAYIVRLADGATAASQVVLDPDATDPSDPATTDLVYVFTATSPGTWGDSVRVTLPTGKDPTTLTVQLLQPPAPNLAAVPAVTETYRNVSWKSADRQFIGTLLLSSALIGVQLGHAGDHMVGTSISGEIPSNTDFTTLNNTGLTVTVNGVARGVAFSGFQAATTLAQVAAAIQTQVTQPPVTNAGVENFTALASGDRLILRSGQAAYDSAVVVGPPSAGETDAGPILNLGATRGTEETGLAQIVVQPQASGEAAAPPTYTFDLTGGHDGQPGTEKDYQSVFTQFVKIRDINIICLPGLTWDEGGKGVIQDAIAHAEDTRSRMVIVDPPDGKMLETGTDVENLGLSPSTYAALYYPWISVSNPDYNAESNPTVPTTVNIPPSGFAAGVWSKIDARRGVWKAPAGTETGLLGVADLVFIAEDAEQDELNPQGVDCIRRFPGYGQVVWGSRTLATNTDPEWRYIPVRRTAMFIEGSIYNGIQWAVFEPNDDQLWSALRASIGSFMDGLFRQGAFQGTTASDAYFVNCGLGSTMTQGDIDAGQVIVLVGFAPLKPAEFVIVRIQQKVGQ